MATKVFIVDDHYVVIEGIRSILQQEKNIEWMGHAMTAASCLAFLAGHQPDVVLMDINLPDRSGIDLCKEVKEKYPSVFILALSTFNQQSFIEQMVEFGASGYLLKNATQQELLEGIETVMTGRLYFSDEAAQSLRKNSDDERPVLTRREKEILELIADGFTNNEIAARLFLGVSTVDTHRKNLLAKFEAKNIASLVKIAVRLQII